LRRWPQAGLLAAAALAWLILAGGAIVPTAAIAAILAVVFFIDDMRGLPVVARFACQFAAAIVFALAAGPFPHPAVLWPLLVVGIVWSMNLYNFMDGANGLAGGMTVIGFGAYALAADATGADDLAVIATMVAGAAAGFLLWNFDPARIFLGDAGSIPLGFLAAAIGVLGWQRDLWPFWFPALVFSPFILDASVTLLRRALRGERLWQAHKSHYYQRLVRMGWSHRRMALSEYALMLAVAGSALLTRQAGAPVAVATVAGWLIIYAAIAASIDRRWRQHEADAGTSQ